MNSRFKSLLAAAVLATGVAGFSTVFAQAQETPAPAEPGTTAQPNAPGTMQGEGMMGMEGMEGGGMMDMMGMMKQMSQMMDTCNEMMQAKLPPSEQQPESLGTSPDNG